MLYLDSVSAVSCLRKNVIRQFLFISPSDENYVILLVNKASALLSCFVSSSRPISPSMVDRNFPSSDTFLLFLFCEIWEKLSLFHHFHQIKISRIDSSEDARLRHKLTHEINMEPNGMVNFLTAFCRLTESNLDLLMPVPSSPKAFFFVRKTKTWAVCNFLCY